ncbi:MAG: hypothetical protein ACYDCN_05705 [Bacteroidia bacterium]
MRKVEFNVAPEIIVEFVEELTNRELSNSLIGTTEEGEVTIEVEYLKTESAEVEELEAIFDKLSAQIEDEDED